MLNYITDLLVVGGSLAGLAAAITAKEENPDLEVLLVEKYTTGYAGKANRGAGIMDMIGNSAPEDYGKISYSLYWGISQRPGCAPSVRE